MEKWKDVEGYEGYYKVSDHGRIKSMDIKTWNGYGFMIRKGRIRKNVVNKKLGYEYITLSKEGIVKTHRVSRLVAIAFVPNTYNKPEVNHKDENKLNNNAENLEWVTSKENANHGTRNIRSGEKHRVAISGRHKSTGNKIYFHSFREAEANGFDGSAIYKCIHNKPKYKTHKGYVWLYA